MHAGNFCNSFYRAYVHAVSALNARQLVNGIFLVTAATNAANRAFFSTKGAAYATVFINVKVHQIQANLCGTALIANM